MKVKLSSLVSVSVMSFVLDLVSDIDQHNVPNDPISLAQFSPLMQFQVKRIWC